MRTATLLALLTFTGCSGAAQEPGGGPPSDGGAGGDAGTPNDAGGSDATPDDGATGQPLALQCHNSPVNANPCPAPSGAQGEATFCFRPQWAGVTGVDVYGGFGKANDWTAPYLTLTNDGTGTFVGKASLPNGTYPYLYRAHGSADNLVRDGMYLLDQENPNFVPHPQGAPVLRSVSSLTVPQTAAALHHVKGTVLFGGAPQGCFSIDLEAGELTQGGKVKSEHYTANLAESAADGTFDFPVANGPFGVIVRYPFLLGGADAGYPNPSAVPSVGVARTNTSVLDGDVVLDAVDIEYPAADYAAMSPVGAGAAAVALPVTFKFTIVPGATEASAAVIGTDIAGNDPLYWSPFGTATSVTWDGTFGGTMGKAMPGTKYYWGSWQKFGAKGDGGVTWVAESLLFEVTFQ